MDPVAPQVDIPRPAYALPPPKAGMPAWLVMLLVAAVLIGGAYFFVNYFTSKDRTETASEPPEKKEEAVKAGSGSSAYAKYIELGGIRINEERKKLVVRVVATNHSAADLPDLKLRVTLATNNGGKTVSTFNVNLPALGAYEVRDLKAEANTTLRAYELPDWQFLKADFEILSP